MSSMSEASMLFQPAIEEPSKKCPLSNLSMVNALTGTDTCCSLPRVSVKRRSTNLTSFSLIIFMTSLADIAISRSPQGLRIIGLEGKQGARTGTRLKNQQNPCHPAQSGHYPHHSGAKQLPTALYRAKLDTSPSCRISSCRPILLRTSSPEPSSGPKR